MDASASAQRRQRRRAYWLSWIARLSPQAGGGPSLWGVPPPRADFTARIVAWLGDQRGGVGTSQLARRRLRDCPGTEHHDVARPHVDLADDLVGYLVLDAAHFGGVLEGIGLDRDGEGLTGMPVVEPHRHRAARTDTGDPASGALDVGRVDVAAGHDDDVFDPAAHHDVAVVHQITKVAGVIPALLILGRDEPAHRDVAGGHRLTPEFDHPDAAGR